MAVASEVVETPTGTTIDMKAPSHALEEQTFHAGVRVLKTRLRKHIYEKLLEHGSEHVWKPMLAMETDFQGPAEAEWSHILARWEDRKDPDLRNALRRILADAYRRAVEDSSLIFSEQRMVTVSGIIRAYEEEKIEGVYEGLIDFSVSTPS
jgi:hypothetical protein